MKYIISLLLGVINSSFPPESRHVMFNAFDSCSGWSIQRTAGYLDAISELDEKFEFAGGSKVIFLREPLETHGLLGNYYGVFYFSESECRGSTFHRMRSFVMPARKITHHRLLYLASDMSGSCDIPSKSFQSVETFRTQMAEAFTNSRHCYVVPLTTDSLKVVAVECDGAIVEHWVESKSDCESLSKRLQN